MAVMLSCTIPSLFFSMYVLLLQGLLEDYDDIVVAAGSVGTACGLAVAKHLTGAAIK